MPLPRDGADPLPLFALVRVLLQEQRAHGSPFDNAWKRVLGGLDEELAILRTQKPIWRAAYDQEPPSTGELAAGRIALVLAEQESSDRSDVQQVA